MNMKKLTVQIIILFAIAVVFAIVIFGSRFKNNQEIKQTTAVPNVEVKDGIQYVTINVRGGYTPRVSLAKAGIPTKLIMKTSGTFDCSSSLVIRSIGYQKILPQNGSEVIDIGTPVVGKPLQVVCGMGMYSFVVNFM